MKYRAMASIIGLFLTMLLIAHANTNINLINETGKPLEFVVSEPDGSTSTDPYTVNSSAHYNFSLDDILAKGCDQHGLCHKTKFWVVLEKWGGGTVYLRCPKMFNPKGGTTYVSLRVGGDDSSTLYCAMSSEKPQKATF